MSSYWQLMRKLVLLFIQGVWKGVWSISAHVPSSNYLFYTIKSKSPLIENTLCYVDTMRTKSLVKHRGVFEKPFYSILDAVYHTLVLGFKLVRFVFSINWHKIDGILPVIVTFSLAQMNVLHNLVKVIEFNNTLHLATLFAQF